MPIPIIDLFAGPGGLGEGFSSVFDKNDNRIFEIKLSIEKEPNAHETLRLRSFYRKFSRSGVPPEFYEVIKQKNWAQRKTAIDKLKLSHPEEWAAAKNEAWCFELPYPEEFDKKGNKKGGYTEEEINERHERIDQRITQALNGRDDFLLIGGPPCQAYSLVGRSRNKGISEEDHRVHLYKEYLRIIAKHHPAVFVMENVKGLLSSKLDGLKIFDLIKQDIKNPASVFPDYNSPRYRIYSLASEPKYDENGEPFYENDTDFLIKSEKYGVPQRRHRVILLGIREDIDHNEQYLDTANKEITLRSVIDQLPKVRSGLNRKFIKHHPTKTNAKGTPKRIYKNLTDSDSAWLEIVNKQVKELDKWGDITINGLSKGIKIPAHGTGGEFVKCENKIEVNHPLSWWYSDTKLDGIPNHQSRTHLTQDLMRYMFASLFVEKYGEFPRLEDYEKYHEDLIPDHANVKSGKFTDRFRVQIADKPATTVTSHISKDGHYFIHYDPAQCRSLTVREAARIQTFPDNYVFCGSRTAQYHQVGNAVPPYLAYQIAKIVKGVYIINYGEAFI